MGRLLNSRICRTRSVVLTFLVLSFLTANSVNLATATPPPLDGPYLLLLSQPNDNNPFDILESSSEKLSIRVNLPDLRIRTITRKDGLTYHLLNTKGAGTTSTVGFPLVPAFSRNILIPNGMTAEIVVDPGDPVSHSNILAYPLQEPTYHLEEKTVVPAFYKEEIAYTSPGYSPGYYAKLVDDGMMRGQHMADLWVYPYQYDPVTRMLHVYPNLKVTVEFRGDIEEIDVQLRSKSFEKIFIDLSLNGSVVLEAEKKVAKPYIPPQLGPYGWDYLIFTVEAFSEAANDLAAWKKQQGFKPLVNIIPPHWTADDITNAISTAYNNWDIPPEYVLLLGDAEFIPTHYVTWHPANEAHNDDNQGTTGTDLYYSLLESTDPLDPWGDLKPEVWIGRISVDEPRQAHDRVQAIIHYESAPTTDDAFYNNVSIAAQFQDGGEVEVLQPSGETVTMLIPPDGISDRRFAQTAEDVAIFLSGSPQNKIITRHYWAEDTTTPTKWNDNHQTGDTLDNFDGPNTKIGGNIPGYLLRRNGFGWNAGPLEISTAINKGAFLLTHRDHGGRTRWSHPSFNNLDAFLLANKNLLPIVWSVNCQTGWFDNETDFKSIPGMTDHTADDAESFSEHWERPFASAISDDHYGAAGVVAGTRVTYSGYNDRLMMGMVDAIWPDYLTDYGDSSPLYEMAAVLYKGKAYMSSTTPKGVKEKTQHETMHWFGDPSMKIRTQKPLLLALLPPDEWHRALTRGYLKIKVLEKDGSTSLDKPIPDAKVSLMKTGTTGELGDMLFPLRIGSPEHWVAYTDADGDAHFPDLQLSSIGHYTITATAPNYLPATTTLTSKAGSAGGIMMDQPGYRCDQNITVKVADIDLESYPTIGIALESGKGDTETVHLTNLGQGYFEGSIPISTTTVAPQDGSIQTEDDDTLIASYFDTDNGRGSGTVTTEALIDCTPPTFDGLQFAVNVMGNCLLFWGEATDSHRPLQYTIYRSISSRLIGTQIGTTSSLSYMDTECSPDTNYYYIVRAVDRLGNEDENRVQLLSF